MPEPKTAAEAQAALLERYEAAEDADSLPAEERAAPAPAPKAEEPPPSVPASIAATDPPKHPAWLLRKAKKLGMDDDDLHELDTDELRAEVAERAAEERTVNTVKAVLNAAGQPYNPANGQLLPRNTPPGTPIASPGAADTSNAAAPGGEPSIRLGVTAQDFENAGYTVELAGLLEKAVAPLVAKIAEQDRTIQQLAGAERSRRTGEALSALDKEFVKHPNLYGEGSINDLEPGSRELKKRMAVIRELQALPPAEQKGIRKDFARVHGELYGDVAAPAPTPETAETNGHVNRIGEKFKGGTVVKPSDGNPPTKRPKGYAAAVAGVEARIKQAQADNDESPEEDDLPD